MADVTFDGVKRNLSFDILKIPFVWISLAVIGLTLHLSLGVAENTAGIVIGLGTTLMVFIAAIRSTGAKVTSIHLIQFYGLNFLASIFLTTMFPDLVNSSFMLTFMMYIVEVLILTIIFKKFIDITNAVKIIITVKVIGIIITFIIVTLVVNSLMGPTDTFTFQSMFQLIAS